jgi:hypothetical protein
MFSCKQHREEDQTQPAFGRLRWLEGGDGAAAGAEASHSAGMAAWRSPIKVQVFEAWVQDVHGAKVQKTDEAKDEAILSLECELAQTRGATVLGEDGAVCMPGVRMRQ